MCNELRESTQRAQEDTGAGSETQGWCMCENGILVWEADIATEVIRYLDVMLNMLPPSLSLSFFPLLSPSFPLVLSLSASLLSLRRLIAHALDTRVKERGRGVEGRSDLFRGNNCSNQ